MAYDINRHMSFNVWANTQLAEVLRTLPDEIYFKENKSSFPSIAKTVGHIWGAQVVWLRRMQGESLTALPGAEGQNKNEILAGLVKSSEDLAAFVRSKDDAFLSRKYAFKNLKGEPFEDPYEDTLFHVVNHSSYHRGQVISMLREAGVAKVPGTDLVHYLRTTRK